MRPSRAVVWVAFALGPVVLAVQTFVISRSSSEPYPALVLPSFTAEPRRDNLAVTDHARFDVRLPGRSYARFDSAQFVGIETLSDASANFVVRHAFARDGSRARDPRTLEWLRSRVRALTGRNDARSVTVVWIRTTYRLPHAEAQSVAERRRIEIPL